MMAANGSVKVLDEVRCLAPAQACFAAGTLVHTREGLKPIEQIKVGDDVLSKPENGGEQAYKRVLKTFAHPPQRVVEVTYVLPGQGQRIITSPLVVTFNHPFWTKEEGWTPPSRMQGYDVGFFHFEDVEGNSIDYAHVQNIYISDQPNVGWTSDYSEVATDGKGPLWDYVDHKLIATNVKAIESVEYFCDSDKAFDYLACEFNYPELLDSDLYFKLPVYNMEVEDFHTYYVGKHGLWVHHSTNCQKAAQEVAP